MLQGCDTVHYLGHPYYSDTVLTDTIFSISGCDSIYRFINIELMGQDPLLIYQDTFACEELWFNGRLFTENSSVSDTVRSVWGCDSVFKQTNIIIEKLDLKLNIDPEDPYEMEQFRIRSTESSNSPYTVLRWLPLEIFPNNDQSKQQFTSLRQAATISMVGRSVNGCLDTAVIFVEPRSYSKDIAVPNAFTPNGDGLNDVFLPKLLLDRAYSTVEFIIYNRFGQVVHNTANMNSGWDGTSNGRPVDQGVYFYSIKIIFVDRTSATLRGEVSLIR